MSDEKRRGGYFLYDFMKVTGALPGLIWMRPSLRYENDAARRRLRGGVLLIANHAGFLDPVYLMTAVWYRRHHFVCMKDFFEGRFRRWLFTRFHCIPIDRENFSMDSLRRITDELRAGRMVSMFPEGHVSADGNIAPFKSGMVLIALQSGCPIVPVYIKKPARFYNRLAVAIGAPVDVRALYGPRPSLKQIDEVAGALHAAEERLRAMCEGES